MQGGGRTGGRGGAPWSEANMVQPTERREGPCVSHLDVNQSCLPPPPPRARARPPHTSQNLLQTDYATCATVLWVLPAKEGKGRKHHQHVKLFPKF